jgi:uncharacterized peroxidase-related enzyme
MAHIALNSDEPGIRGLFRFRPETARPLNELVEVLLREPNTLTRGERELIASYVSSLNQCKYCCSSHSAYAAAQLPEGLPLVRQVCTDVSNAPVSPKLRALLDIAAAVQKGGLYVTQELTDAARAEGATDTEIHDCVLIAAAFCMFNRYVDGLGTFAPDDPDVYSSRAQRIVEVGYLGLLAESQRALPDEHGGRLPAWPWHGSADQTMTRRTPASFSFSRVIASRTACSSRYPEVPAGRRDALDKEGIRLQATENPAVEFVVLDRLVNGVQVHRLEVALNPLDRHRAVNAARAGGQVVDVGGVQAEL